MTVTAHEVELDVPIGTLELDSGESLPNVVQRVTRLGCAPAPDGSNVVFAPHALTGSSRVTDWWSGIFGAGTLFDPERWCIVGVNVVGGCYGSTGPTTLAPDGKRWGPRFPVVTVGDIVEAQRRALSALGIDRLGVIVGGSLGGFQALQWAHAHPGAVGHAIVIGAYDHLRAQGIAQNGAARDAIRLDPAFRGGWYDEPPVDGLRLARAIATLTYKSEHLFEQRFRNRPDRKGGEPGRRLDDRFDVEGYLVHQGDLFAARIDANSYRTLTRAMDLFDLRGRERPAGSSRLTFVGIAGDQLYPPEHVWSCAARWAEAGWDAAYRHLPSDHGHDAFLAEAGNLADLLRDGLARDRVDEQWPRPA
ncbi:MAG: homoserine O-acetyltransferase [Candidatus Eremiobacteraeota bacterium]|nr:homoserine O-acetyltransferase [Candidatus Eremiobacteraeota bacterium]